MAATVGTGNMSVRNDRASSRLIFSLGKLIRRAKRGLNVTEPMSAAVHTSQTELTGKEIRVLHGLRKVKSCTTLCQKPRFVLEEDSLPLLKNLSWSFLPTIINAPSPPVLSFTPWAFFHPSCHSLSTTSKAGFNPPSISSTVNRLSCP